VSKDFEAMVAGKAKTVKPLSREERTKARVAYGHSFPFSLAARYEATIELFEKKFGILEENDGTQR
jgi:hypothetical protein